MKLAANAADRTPPSGLVDGGSGRRLWASVVDVYVLRPDEMRLLEDACHLADRIDERETRAADLRTRVGTELFVRGSTRQSVKNPLLDEARQELAEQRKDRIALNDLLTRLKLVDLDGETPPTQQPGDDSRRSASA